MPTALQSLVIGEVSGVDAPAHLTDGWMVMKAAGASPEQIEAVETVELLVDSIAKAAHLDRKLLAEIGTEVLDEQARSVLKALTSTPAKEASNMPDFDKSTLDPEALAYVEAVESERDEAVAKAAAITPAPLTSGEVTDDEFRKAVEDLPEPIAKALLHDREELRKARETAETERNLRLDAEYLAKAKTLSQLPEAPEALAKTLRRVADADPVAYVEVDRLLKAANEQLESASIFKAIGEGAAHVTTGSAHEQLDAFAKAKVAADPSLDYATALAAASEENPDLYAQHRRETLASTQEG